jgi:hypothetical protein
MAGSRRVTYTELAPDVRELTDRIIWCVLATVGPDDRPRSRIVHPVWSHTDPPTGYLASRPTPLRRRHLASHRHVTCAYWTPAHDAVYIDAEAAWLTGPDERRAAWDFFAATPEPVGFDPATIWPNGPDAADFGVIRLRPYRILVARAAAMAAGDPSPMWTATADERISG